MSLTLLRFTNFIGPSIDTPLTRYLTLPAVALFATPAESVARHARVVPYDGYGTPRLLTVLGHPTAADAVSESFEHLGRECRHDLQ